MKKNNNKNEKKILNLGCGKGQNIPSLIGKGDIYCVDINSYFINQAKKQFPFCHFFSCSAEDISFEHNFFDEVYCYDVLEHVDDYDLVINKIHKILKPGGLLYVEIPFEYSEKMLLKIRKSYFDEIGHKRIFELGKINSYFKNFIITKIVKTRGIVNLYLWVLFKLNIGLSDQMSGVSLKDRFVERIIFMFTIWFDKNLFNTFLKYIPIWIITLPIGVLIDQFFPKTLIIYLKNEKK